MTISTFPYHVGGSLTWNEPSYINRQADNDLQSAIAANQFAYVLGARQIGKSSLRTQARHQLIQKGYSCVTLQATQLQELSGQTPTGQKQSAQTQLVKSKSDNQKLNHKKQCGSFISTLYTDLNLDRNDSPKNFGQLVTWLKSTEALPDKQRLDRFTNDFLTSILSHTPVVIFIDEVDALLETPFITPLFRWIARCYERRQSEPIYNNLNFVVLGSAIASDLVWESKSLSRLFATGRQISLEPFQLIETYGLHQGFEEKIDDPTTLLKAIYRWAHGQPFLTQKLCHITSRLIEGLVCSTCNPIVLSTRAINQWVDETVRSHIITDWKAKDNPVHLRAICDRLNRSPNRKALLMLYKKILQGAAVLATDDYIQAELRLSGIVIVRDGQLQVANNIYRQVLTLA